MYYFSEVEPTSISNLENGCDVERARWLEKTLQLLIGATTYVKKTNCVFLLN